MAYDGAGATWTEDRVQKLESLWRRGFSAAEISNQMDGITRNAVIGKIHRLGLARKHADEHLRKGNLRRPQFWNPERVRIARKAWKDGWTIQEIANALGRHRGVVSSFVSANANMFPERERPRKKDVVERQKARIVCATPLLELGRNQCRFTDDKEHFCGAPTKDGESWCEDHKAIVFVRKKNAV